MKQLGDRRTARRLYDHLACLLGGGTLGPSDREVVAAALVCLQPVLPSRGMPADKSPTLEIVFNVQLDAWLKRDKPALAN
jgi:hypothetical protein